MAQEVEVILGRAEKKNGMHIRPGNFTIQVRDSFFFIAQHRCTGSYSGGFLGCQGLCLLKIKDIHGVD
jgi:hypothetical protein